MNTVQSSHGNIKWDTAIQYFLLEFLDPWRSVLESWALVSTLLYLKMSQIIPMQHNDPQNVGKRTNFIKSSVESAQAENVTIH
jgi:hypothetical protein